MKKLVTTALAVLACGVAFALPIGNPSEASLYMNGVWCDSTACCDPCDPCFSWCDAWSLRTGFYGDYVFNRHLEVDNGAKADIDITTISTNAGYIALNICDRVDIFTTLGASKIIIETEEDAWGNIGTDDYTRVLYQTDFSWSIGARATLWECDCWALGVEGQYFRTCPDVDYALDYNSGNIGYNDSLSSSEYWEWQVGIGASYRIATSCPTLAMVPYMGVKWSGSKLTNDSASAINGFTLTDLENKKLWGYAVGMTFTLCDMIGVNVEGRFADEKAVSVLAQVRF